MSSKLQKYLHETMDKEAGVDHISHKTKIVATVGPACDSYEKLLALVKAGVNVFRLNFSHGSHEGKADIIESIRKINLTEPYNISILGDLQGPKLRVGEIENNALEVFPGDILTFTNQKVVGNLERIYVSYPNLHSDVKVGNKIMIDDGKMEVEVISVEPNHDVKVEVTMGGIISSKKGINLPDTKISLPALTEKDLIDLDFIIEKQIIRKCLHRAKPVIVATQMMESMIDRSKPNRSEITDVANAVLEGTDAVMLSGETATGKHPVLVVETMRRIIMQVEKTDYRYNLEDELVPQPHSPSFLSDAICYNACKLARDTKADALIGMTQSGYTAFMLSSYRPASPLYIFSKEKSLINQLSLSWGVRAFLYGEEQSLDEIISDQIEILKERGFIKSGDLVVNTGSTPVHLHLPTNVLKITRVE